MSDTSTATQPTELHDWWQWSGLTCCKKCGIVRRADGGNAANPCPGVVKVALRRTEETGWLVELRGNRPTWWALGPDEEPGWTTDSTHALRFARKIDAEAYIEDAEWTEAFASEHMWETTS